MPRSSRGSGSPRRHRAEAGASGQAKTRARPRDARSTEVVAPRFRIYIVDSGWNSPAHRVLVENFALIRDLQKDDPIYVLSREQSIEFQRRHGSRIGRDPIIAVRDMEALDQGGTTGFHGFRLVLGLLRTPQQALQGLQAFARFLATHPARRISKRTSAPTFAVRGFWERSRSSCIMRRAKWVNDR